MANPLTRGGANGENLYEYQQRALGRWPLAAHEIEEEGERYRRDPHWRPLSNEEIAFYSARTEGGTRWVFMGVFRIEGCYWIRSPLTNGGPAAV